MGISRDDTISKQAVLTASRAAVASHASNLDRTMRYKLGADRTRLKKIASMQRKAEIKSEIIPEYLPYLDGLIAGHGGNDILTQVMVWAFDAQNIVIFDRLARYALNNRLAMPTDFARSLGAWLAESVAKLILKLVDGSIDGVAFGAESIEIIQSLAPWVLDQTMHLDMHDEIRSKLYRACAEVCVFSDPALALNYFEQALKLDAHIRIKTRIKLLKEQLALTESPTSQGQADDGLSNATKNTPNTLPITVIPAASAMDGHT